MWDKEVCVSTIVGQLRGTVCVYIVAQVTALQSYRTCVT